MRLAPKRLAVGLLPEPGALTLGKSSPGRWCWARFSYTQSQPGAACGEAAVPGHSGGDDAVPNCTTSTLGAEASGELKEMSPEAASRPLFSSPCPYRPNTPRRVLPEGS